MMPASIYLSRFLALLCIVFPVYIAIRGPASLSDITLHFSSLSKRAAEALYVSVPATFISKEPVEASTEPVKPARTPQGSGRKKYPSSLPDGLAHCINSFEQYPVLAEKVLQRKYARYSKQTPAQRAISDRLDYHAHFEKARKGIEVNARFWQQIAQIAREDYHTGPGALEDDQEAELIDVNTAFAHVQRDWSTQGAEERQAVFPPILGGLGKHFGAKKGRGNKVLVPGSGMGRLASDIADLGKSILITWSTSMTTSHTHGRIRRDSQRARLRLHRSLPPAHEPHDLAAPAHSTTVRDHMGSSGQPFLALLGRDSAGPLAKQGRQARRGRLLGNVSPGR